MAKPIRSVARASSILDYLADRPEAKLSELSAHLNISKTTLFGIAETLCQQGFAYKNPISSGYSIGPKLITYGQPLSNDQLTRLVHPYLQVVANEFHETIFLTVLQDQRVHYIAKVDADLPPKMGEVTNTTSDSFLYNTAAGKTLLSTFLPAELTVYLDQLEQTGKLTETEVRKLNRELIKIRQANLAYDLGEQAPNVNCVSVGIRNYRHEVLASMAVVLIDETDPTDKLHALAARMQTISTALETRLV